MPVPCVRRDAMATQQFKAQPTNQQLSLLPRATSPSALHPPISWAVKAFALLASSSCAPVGLAVGSCARSLPAAEWTGATMRSGSCWVGRPTKALGFWSCSVFRFAGSWGGGVRVTKMATRGSGSAHTTATYTTARETLEPTLTNVV